MSRFKYIAIALIILIGAYSVNGKSRYAASFLELGVGARPLAMGGAYVALSQDAYGFYWNPAGLALLPGFQTATMYASLFNELENQSYVSAALPIFGGATASVSWVRLSIDDIPWYPGANKDITAYQRISGNAEPLTAEPERYFSSADDAFFITFAKYIPYSVDLGWQYFEVPVDFGMGINLKLINQTIDKSRGSGVGIDAGFLMRVGLNQIFVDSYYGDLAFGLNIQDLAETQITWDTDSKHKDRIARNFKYGISYIQPLTIIDSQLAIAYDINSVYNGSTHLGGEFVYKSLLAIRLGLNGGFFTTGAGISIWKFKFDYAYQSHDLGNSHRVSLLMGF